MVCDGVAQLPVLRPFERRGQQTQRRCSTGCEDADIMTWRGVDKLQNRPPSMLECVRVTSCSAASESSRSTDDDLL